MSVYVINFVSNMLLGALMLSNQNNLSKKQSNRRKGWYLFITFLQFALVCGFRDTTVGYDTYNYSSIFKSVPTRLDDVIDSKLAVEVGFRVFCYFIKSFGGTYQTMFILSSLFVMGSVCIFIYRHSNNPWLSVFIIISFPYYYSSFDIIRHFMATSFFLLGYKYIEQRKPIKYLLLIFLGSLFHSFAWIYLFFYFFRKIKWNFMTFFIAALVTVFCYLYIERIAVWFSGVIGKSDGIDSGWIGEFGGGIKTALMYGAVFIISLLAYYNLDKKDDEDMTAVNMVLLMFIFSILFLNARMMTRLIMTSVPLLAIAIPRLLDSKRVNEKRDYFIYMIVFLVVGIIYHAFMLNVSWQSVVPYVAYWE